MSPARTTVGLAMIVKNEELTLPRLAASVAGQIDHWTIVDTGSTDGTVALAEELFHGIPGQIICDEWRGYGPSRNVALDAARPHSQWLLTFDADETVDGTIERDIPPECDAVEAECRFDPLCYWITRMVRADDDWRWYGRAHEFLARVGRDSVPFRTGRFLVRHHADGGNRATKLERELALLRADHRDDPDDQRTLFYLARTYEDMGESARAATWYRRRIEAGGWEEESWYATWRLGLCLLAAGRADEGCGVLWTSWGRRRWRAEPLWTLAQHYRSTGQWILCAEVCRLARQHCGVGSDRSGTEYGGDRLFVHADVYRWRMTYEESICSFYVGAYERGLEIADELLALPDLPPVIAQSVQENRGFYVDHPDAPPDGSSTSP